jgi:hypothetical protein
LVHVKSTAEDGTPGCTVRGDVSRKCSIHGYPGGEKISSGGGGWQVGFGTLKRKERAGARPRFDVYIVLY